MPSRRSSPTGGPPPGPTFPAGESGRHGPQRDGPASLRHRQQREQRRRMYQEHHEAPKSRRARRRDAPGGHGVRWELDSGTRHCGTADDRRLHPGAPATQAAGAIDVEVGIELPMTGGEAPNGVPTANGVGTRPLQGPGSGLQRHHQPDRMTRSTGSTTRTRARRTWGPSRTILPCCSSSGRTTRTWRRPRSRSATRPA